MVRDGDNFTGTPAPGTGGNLSVDGKQATIDLGRTTPSASVHPGQRHIVPVTCRFAALRQFEIWACNNKGGVSPAHKSG